MISWPTVRWLSGRLGLVLLGALLAVAVLIGCGFLILRLFFPRPSEHHNPSFRYGERVFRSIYDNPTTQSVEDACKAAIKNRFNHPKPFDFDEAASGCKYEEWILDN